MHKTVMNFYSVAKASEPGDMQLLVEKEVRINILSVFGLYTILALRNLNPANSSLACLYQFLVNDSSLEQTDSFKISKFHLPKV